MKAALQIQDLHVIGAHPQIDCLGFFIETGVARICISEHIKAGSEGDSRGNRCSVNGQGVISRVSVPLTDPSARMNLAAARKFALGDVAFAVKPSLLEIAAADAEIRRLLVFYIDDQNHAVGLCEPGLGSMIVDEKKSKASRGAFLAATDQNLVEGIALGQVELAADHIVAGTGVAADLDALDIGARAFVDQIDHGNGAVGVIAITARGDGGEGITLGRDTV